MKKLLALTLACLMLTMCFVACGTNNDNADNTTTTVGNDNTTTPADTTTAAPELAYDSAEALLKHIMDSYNATAAEETKLYVCGGNPYNFETVNPEGPAKFVALEDADYDTHLGYPAADISKLDDAAYMFNMINVNTFSCYAVHFANSADVDGMVSTLKDNILARQWICGTPEKLAIVKAPGDYLIVVWGAVSSGGIVDPFVAGVTAAVDGAQIVVEQNIVE
ncbi:MAG: hypothetical protein IJY27_00720 [Clostridia bacterium]|nr:hypothetical protein [Clostridia bacterium]